MIQILVLVILIALNAFFAASEMAFISLNDAKVEKEAKSGNKKAKQIHKMMQEPSRFLSTIQIGITLAGFLSSAFASESFADDLAPILNNLIPLGISTWNTISIVLITINAKIGTNQYLNPKLVDFFIFFSKKYNFQIIYIIITYNEHFINKNKTGNI